MLFDQLIHCRPWLEAAIAYGDGCHDFDSVAAGVLTGRFRLWVRPKGCAVTEIQVYPKKRVCNVFLAGGDMQTILDLEEPCMEYAMNQGCADVVLTGRDGWERVLGARGWEKTHTSMRRKLT